MEKSEDTGHGSDGSQEAGQTELPRWFADRPQGVGDRLPVWLALSLLAVGIAGFVGGWALPVPPPEAPDATWPVRLSIIAAGLIVVVLGLRGRNDRITYWMVLATCTATGGFSVWATAIQVRDFWVLLILLPSAVGVLLTQMFGRFQSESDQASD